MSTEERVAETDHDNDPYAEGADAALEGKSDTTNPYPLDSDDHLSWNDGWLSVAEDEDEDAGVGCCWEMPGSVS